ncbi:MAG: PhzF family phenazine biosynthesis protein [Nitrospinaceae bacterium]
MKLKLIQVDAFTHEPFKGNPAAVCLLTGPRPEEWMQNVAREMNLSETAFLLREDGGFNLRWFTPTTEVDLCGHATLASAHVLWELGYLEPGQPAIFNTRSGRLTARRRDPWIEMDFPKKRAEKIDPPDSLLQALGTTADFTGFDGTDYLVAVPSENTVRALAPHLSLLRSLPVRGVMVTGPSDTPEYDFVSRFFAPRCGIDEDPVTGSAHCCLGPFWANQLNKTHLLAYQASARGGVVRVEVQADRVILGGRAVTIMRGELE